MREHIIQTLKTLTKGGHEITEADMISWANDAVKRGGKASSINSFRDTSLRNGLFFLDMLNGVKKGVVDYQLVTDGVTGASNGEREAFWVNQLMLIHNPLE